MSNIETDEQRFQNLDLDNYKDMSVGEILCKTRKYYGKTIAEVEADLRIRSSQLDALEKLRLDKLPGRVYAIGFVRSYSEYLGLDGDKMVHLFKAQSVGRRAKPNLQFPVTYDENNTPNIFVILISLVGIIFFISYWVMFKTPQRYQDTIPPVPAILQKSSLEGLKEKERNLDAVEALPQTKNTMELLITQDSWVEIKNADGDKLISQVLKAGDKYIVPEEEGLTLTTGNAGGVSVIIKGEKAGTVGKTSQVKRNVKLELATFETSQ